MNKFQITADIDAAVWLGVVKDFQSEPIHIDYGKLKELLELDGTDIPSHNELEHQLVELSQNIKKEFMLYLCEVADEWAFKIDNMVVYLPIFDDAFVARHGAANIFVNGTFEAIVEANVSKEDVSEIVGVALDRATDAVYADTDYLCACSSACLDVQKIGD